MTNINIIINNPITGRIGTGVKKVRPLLFYKVYSWKRKEERKKYLISTSGYFYLGLLDRIISLCQKKGYRVNVSYSKDCKEYIDHIAPNFDARLPKVEGFTSLYPRQQKLVESALKGCRGYIISPTGSGKTVVMLSVAKAFENYRGLILVPGLSLLTKTEKDLRKFGFESLAVLGDGNKDMGNANLVLSTIQTFRELDLEKLAFEFDFVLIDEGHLAQRHLATYEQIMSKLMAPIRLGFTATFPRNNERAYNAEGLLGPILDEITQDEGEELNIVTSVEVEIVCVPASRELKNIFHYKEMYDKGIVHYKLRNMLVVNKTIELIERGEKVLVASADKNIEHGKILEEMLKKEGVRCIYIYGNTSPEERENVIQDVEEGEIDCVLASRIWREGVNVPMLSALVNARGGKGEDQAGMEGIVQWAGRVRRVREGKNIAIVADFLDSCKYLAEWSSERIAAYRRLGWNVFID